MAVMSLTGVIVDAAGERHTLTTNTYDLYRAEQRLGELSMLTGKPKLAEMIEVLFSAAQRAGIAGDDLDAWLQEVEIDLDAESDPKG